jgi:hypothetical protein
MYLIPKPISHQNTKLTQQHNWKKGSSSPRVASVFVSLSVILSVRKGQERDIEEKSVYQKISQTHGLSFLKIYRAFWGIS